MSYRDALLPCNKSLRPFSADVTWVKMGDFHITVNFFGLVEKQKMESLITTIEHAVGDIGPMTVSVTALGAFPNLCAPRNIWAGVADTENRLPRLSATIERATKASGFTSDQRPFTGHITIGRIRSHKNITALTKRMMTLQESTYGSFDIHSVDVVCSVLSSDGPEYTCLKSIAL